MRNDSNLGKILKQQRTTIPLTLQELTATSGVSASHLGRIERGERFPSAHILRRLAKPLGFGEDELFTLAGFLSPTTHVAEDRSPVYSNHHLDPYVAKTLSEEPVEIQQAVISILTMLKSIAKGMSKENNRHKEID